ncbi:DUF1415 domain-containing protein [Endozoicomonas sp. G2_1]|uniref:DUF1415 domain-containing protein n=1 Tax=Endozoicomonas sp. G2_1 TaxID=2821091 RepID=UPI001ADB6BDB|nr:DUF1415 domain-containing protein [Endozoicomonas sp. G2_1]MBO9491383.1 DUF1415 domain-containing protein [Endozoicomonas sp. G2_1]
MNVSNPSLPNSLAQSHKDNNVNAVADTTAILQTKAWLEQIVIGLNFCPFAKKEFVNNTIHYVDSQQIKITSAIDELASQFEHLANNPQLETSLVIYSQGFTDFEHYLELLDYSQDLLEDMGFEGEFQLASFHPDYCFADQSVDDVTNFTNKSPWPTLHIIREQSMSKVLATYKQPEQIPLNNMSLARDKGYQFFAHCLASIKQKTANGSSDGQSRDQK